MRSSPPARRRACPSGGFSLVELLVAMAVLALLMGILAQVSDQVMRSWKQAGAQAKFYTQARSAMDVISRRLSQATLNPYLAYDNPANPRRYVRKSNLRFLIEPAAELLGPDFGPGSALFFQAPLGRATDAGQRSLVGLINTCGFYVKRAVPPPLPFGQPSEGRYSLMEIQTSAETVAPLAAIPSAQAQEADLTWASRLPADAATRAYERELAANVILFLALPLQSDASGRPVSFSGSLSYNSAAGSSANPQPSTANQLPPFVEIILVALSEEAAARFDSSGIDPSAGFDDPSTLEQELQALAGKLSSSGLTFRILRTQVALPNSRWQG